MTAVSGRTRNRPPAAARSPKHDQLAAQAKVTEPEMS